MGWQYDANSGQWNPDPSDWGLPATGLAMPTVVDTELKKKQMSNLQDQAQAVDNYTAKAVTSGLAALPSPPQQFQGESANVNAGDLTYGQGHVGGFKYDKVGPYTPMAEALPVLQKAAQQEQQPVPTFETALLQGLAIPGMQGATRPATAIAGNVAAALGFNKGAEAGREAGIPDIPYLGNPAGLVAAVPAFGLGAGLTRGIEGRVGSAVPTGPSERWQNLPKMSDEELRAAAAEISAPRTPPRGKVDDANRAQAARDAFNNAGGGEEGKFAAAGAARQFDEGATYGTPAPAASPEVRTPDYLKTAPPVIEAPATAMHGTGVKFEAFDESRMDQTALFGPGVYLTDNEGVAAGYAKARSRKTGLDEGGIQDVQVKPGTRLVNLEQPLPPDVGQAIINQGRNLSDQGILHDADAWYQASKAIQEGKTGREVYNAFKDGLEDDMLSYGDAGEAMDALNQTIKAAGYDGLAHIGGVGKGNPHNVSILFDPASVIRVTPRVAASAAVPPASPPVPPATAAETPPPPSGGNRFGPQYGNAGGAGTPPPPKPPAGGDGIPPGDVPPPPPPPPDAPVPPSGPEPPADKFAIYQSLDDEMRATLEQSQARQTAAGEKRTLFRGSTNAADQAATRVGTAKKVLDKWLETEQVASAAELPVHQQPLLSHIQSSLENRGLGGNPNDSMVSNMLHVRGNIIDYLTEKLKFSTEEATKLADNRVSRLLEERFGNDIPPALMKEIDDARFGKANPVLQQGATFQQRILNTVFPFDFGVAGVQGLAAAERGGIPALIGIANRILTAAHAPGFRSFYAGSDIPAMAQRIIDGASYHAQSGLVTPGKGTLLSYGGKPGKALDSLIERAVIDPLNKVQFDTVMSTARDMMYEGNLRAFAAMGREITPLVRRQAMSDANTWASQSRTALNPNRAAGERSLLLTPTMTRSGIETVNVLSRIMRTGSTPEQRMMAAMSIASMGLSTILIGKVVNDAVGLRNFEFDPTDPDTGDKFGRITVATGDPRKDINIQTQSQRAFFKALTDSIAAIRGGNPEELATAWGKYSVSRQGFIPGQIAQNLPGGLATGYDENGKFYLGGLPDLSLQDRAERAGRGLIPAGAASVEQGKITTPEQLLLQVFGASSFESTPASEESLSLRERAAKAGLSTQEIDRIQKVAKPYWEYRSEVDQLLWAQAQAAVPAFKNYASAADFEKELRDNVKALGGDPDKAVKSNSNLQSYFRQIGSAHRNWLDKHPEIEADLKSGKYGVPK